MYSIGSSNAISHHWPNPRQRSCHVGVRHGKTSRAGNVAVPWSDFCCEKHKLGLSRWLIWTPLCDLGGSRPFAEIESEPSSLSSHSADQGACLV